MVTVLKRGAAPVDPISPYVDTHQVYVSPGGEVWDAMLNQTNIGKNANKFYVLQLLHPVNNTNACTLFVRWGRTGENGTHQSKGPWAPAQAINEFKKQFKSKTATAWEDKKGMAAKPGKYTWLERDFESVEKEDKDEGPSKGKGKGNVKPVSEKIPESTLAAEVQNLCRIIFNTGFMEAVMSSLNYDANKLPLGKLSKATVLKGFAALKSLSEVIEDPVKAAQYGGMLNACSEFSGQYYSIIPHVFGRNKPIVICSMPQLKKELELVDTLGDMEIAQKLISEKVDSDESGQPLNPLDAHFRSLSLESMVPVATNSREFTSLATYAKDTHGASHAHYTVTLETAFRVRRKFEDENWSKAGFDNIGDGQRLLLWHGSRSTNFAGILSQGLRIAPPEAPVNGYMFGKGVYFADMMSKSYNYCYPSSSGNMGILLLCDVVAKPCLELNNASCTADQECKTAGKLATKGIGRTQPVDWQDAGSALDNDELKGCLMPKGAAKDVNPPGAYLMYNEYIVYNTAQIRVKYLLMVRMK
ncbi:PARP-domain-containing protein [Phellopilus nigrolimitatus]|nr:PARP-domain-containing protein [Phellopilus nigrolimitatus]